MHTDEWSLLRQYVAHRSQAAFTQLVERYVDFVYGTCVRQLGDHHLAEDVCQGVFLVLAQKADRLSAKTVMSAWLFQVARHACGSAIRMRKRRRRHQAAAAIDPARAPARNEQSDMDELKPLLDDAVSRLREADRQAVLLRYFEGRSVGEVAAALGITENTASHRLVRAVEKLRMMFAAQGFTLSAAVITGAVSATAPATTRVACIAAGSPSGALGATSASTLAKKVITIMRWTTLKPILAVCAVVLILGGAAVVAQQVHQPPAAPRNLAASPAAVSPASRPASEMNGRVLGADGVPVAGAIVCFVSGPDYLEPQGTITKTGADGRFSLPTPPDEPRKELDRWPALFACVPGVGFSGTIPYPSGNYDLRLRPAVDVRVTCVGTDEKPIRHLQIAPSIILGDGYMQIPREVWKHWSLTTGDLGQCTFHGLPPGVQIQFATDDARFAQLSLEDRILSEGPAPISVKIHLQKAGSIAGVVINPETHKPVPNVPIGDQGTDASPSAGGTFATTDATGHYRLSRVKAGDYVVNVCDQLMPGDWTAKAAVVHLDEGQNISANLMLTRGGFVKGQVRDADTGKPIPGRHIGLYGPATPRIAAHILGATTDAQGNYSIRTPAGGQYVYISDEIVMDMDPPHHDVDVTNGKTTIVNFDIHRDHSATLHYAGAVLGPDGRPIKEAVVTCDDPDRPDALGSTKVATTDSAGKFQLDNLKAGSIIRAQSKDGNLATEHSITVDGSTDNGELRLSAGAKYTMTVKVTDPAGVAIAGAGVELITMAGQSGWGQDHIADAKGICNLDSLWADGQYSVEASAPGYGHSQKQVAAPPLGNPRVGSMTLVLKKATSVIAGIVVDAQGKPAAHVKVSINGVATGAASTETDAQGHFHFQVVDDAAGVIVYLAQSGNHSMPPHAIAKAGDDNLQLTVGTAAK